ncbi:MAG: hypothetical protein AAB414_00130 [Patescibacteria group bacterium]
MQKELLLALSLSVIIFTSFLVIISDTGPSRSELDSAINKATHIYAEIRLKGMDFSNGPCLSNALMPDWVLDIVHNPRILTDDLQENQCPAYIEGRARHFVELDTEGNLIRAR